MLNHWTEPAYEVVADVISRNKRFAKTKKALVPVANFLIRAILVAIVIGMLWVKWAIDTGVWCPWC